MGTDAIFESLELDGSHLRTFRHGMMNRPPCVIKDAAELLDHMKAVVMPQLRRRTSGAADGLPDAVVLAIKRMDAGFTIVAALVPIGTLRRMKALVTEIPHKVSRAGRILRLLLPGRRQSQARVARNDRCQVVRRIRVIRVMIASESVRKWVPRIV